MKTKLYLCCFFMVIASVCNAQIQKGDVLLGGDLNFSGQKSAGPQKSTTGFGIGANYGKFIRDNTMVGVALGYDYSNPGGLDDYNSNRYSAGLFLRKYKSLGNRFYVFINNGLNFIYVNSKNVDSTVLQYKTKEYNVNIGLSPGIAYGLTDRVMVELYFLNIVQANYDRFETSIPNGTGFTKGSTTNYNFSSTLSSGTVGNLAIGFKVLLGGTRKQG